MQQFILLHKNSNIDEYCIFTTIRRTIPGWTFQAILLNG